MQVYFSELEIVILLSSTWFIYYQFYMCRQKQYSFSQVFTCCFISLSNAIQGENGIFEYSLFFTRMEILYFPWNLQEAATFHLSTINPCDSVSLCQVTVNCYLRRHPLKLYPLMPLSVDAWLSVEALAVDECLSVEAPYPWKLWVIRWSLWFYPLKAYPLAVDTTSFIQRLQGINYFQLTTLSCTSGW